MLPHVHKWLTHSHLDATSATLKPHTAGQDTAAVNATYESNIAAINSAITGATTEIQKTLAGPAHARRELALTSRQATTSLPGELALIIEEIGGALNQIIATLGLSKHLFPILMLVSQLTLNLLSYHTFIPWSFGHLFGRTGCISYPCCEQPLDGCWTIARRSSWRIERRSAWAHFVSKLGRARTLGMVESVGIFGRKEPEYPAVLKQVDLDRIKICPDAYCKNGQTLQSWMLIHIT